MRLAVVCNGPADVVDIYNNLLCHSEQFGDVNRLQQFRMFAFLYFSPNFPTYSTILQFDIFALCMGHCQDDEGRLNYNHNYGWIRSFLLST